LDLDTAVVVASFAFQLAGAVILLLWSLWKIDKKIKSMSIENDGIPIVGFDNTTVISKKDLQKNAKKVYINIAAFLNLVIGYGAAIFAEDSTRSNCYIFILVVFVTFLIIVFELLLSGVVAKLRYNADQKVNVNDMENKPPIIFRTTDK
jgi:hypothetical protein